MIDSQFGSILKAFEQFFGCPLVPDERNSCLLDMEEAGISLQIEFDKSGQILMGTRLGVLQMGRYRDDVIKEALKANHTENLSSGIMAFSRKSNQLILFTKLHPDRISPSQLEQLLPPFIARAKQWKEIIAQGKAPVPTPIDKVPSGLFGIISE